tara:strand:- start:108 stop:776 length:669 start_codon:yes stop_codon:yes gene_type:complete
VLKNFILIGVLTLYSINSFSETENLWKGFHYNMSPSEVLYEISKTKITTKYGREQIGFEPTIRKNIKQDPEKAITLEGYCSIFANEKLKVAGYKAFVQWCFDKPTSRKEPNPEAKLKFIKIKIKNQFTDVRSKVTSRYKEVFANSWLRQLEVEEYLIQNCKSTYAVTFAEKDANVLVIHKISDRAESGMYLPWMMFTKKDEMIESLKTSCLETINELLSDDL